MCRANNPEVVPHPQHAGLLGDHWLADTPPEQNFVFDFQIPSAVVNTDIVQYVTRLPLVDRTTFNLVNSLLTSHVNSLVAEGFYDSIAEHLVGTVDYFSALVNYASEERRIRSAAFVGKVRELYLHLEAAAANPAPCWSFSRILFARLRSLGFTGERYSVWGGGEDVTLPHNYRQNLTTHLPNLIVDWIALKPNLVKVANRASVPESAAILTVPQGIGVEVTFTKEELFSIIVVQEVHD